MGILRLLLALSVMLDHANGLGAFALLGGPLAVQCFFIISGFYMGLVLNERYDRPTLNRAFYANRAIRIYGIYFVFLALHLATFAFLHRQTGHSPLDPYFVSDLGPGEKAGLAALNLTVIGQDLPLWLTQQNHLLVWSAQPSASDGDALFHFMMIPAAWSLSLELCFYLLAPFIARRPAWQVAVLMAASLLARLLGAALGWTADPWLARFFPFELALFLGGVLAYKAWSARPNWWQRPAMRAWALALPAAILTWPLWSAGPIRPVFHLAPACLVDGVCERFASGPRVECAQPCRSRDR